MQILFDYIRDVIYDPENATIDFDIIPDEMKEFARGVLYFASCVLETKDLAMALSRGNLNASPASRGNEIAAPLKSLHASLRHLTWQAQRIAQGDYSQRVSFMGDFSDAFNTMVMQLSEREQNLKEKISQVEDISTALAESNKLLTTLIHFVPQQIFVVNSETSEVLMSNEIASENLIRDKNYLNNIIYSVNKINLEGTDIELEYNFENDFRHLSVRRFLLDWNNEKVNIYIIDDITQAKKEQMNLETRANIDTLTGLYNRTYGMEILDKWLSQRKKFSLVFIDLDNLKYLNDTFGHEEGDFFITRSAYELSKYSRHVIACRIGGDEFMLLSPDSSFDDTNNRMNEISDKLKAYKLKRDPFFTYNISFGIAAVDENVDLTASEILHVADLRMYEHKHRNKRLKMKSGQSKQQ